MTVSTVKYRKPIPFKVFAVVIILFAVVVFGLLYMLVPNVQVMTLDFMALSTTWLVTQTSWLFTSTPFWIGAGSIAFFAIIISTRNYWHKKKITMITQAPSQLQGGLIQTNPLPLIQQDNIIVEDKKA